MLFDLQQQSWWLRVGLHSPKTDSPSEQSTSLVSSLVSVMWTVALHEKGFWWKQDRTCQDSTFSGCVLVKWATGRNRMCCGKNKKGGAVFWGLALVFSSQLSEFGWELPINQTNCTLARPPIRVMVRVGAGLGRVRGTVLVRGGQTNAQFFGLMGGRTNSMLPVGILNTN